jgi:SSS family solute:Na+ symporter
MTEPLIQQNQLIMWAVVIVYMVLITFAGSYYSKYMRTADAYFKAGNAIPWWAAGISTYVSHFTAYTFVAIASLVYIDGLSGLLLETGPALVYLMVALFFAKRWHRLNLTSPPEYLEARFSPLTRKVFSGLGIATTFVASGMRLYAMAKLAEALMGLPLIWTIILMGAVMIVYTMLGGLWAVIVTDIVQFIVLFLGVIPLFVIAVVHIFTESSLTEFINNIPANYATFPNPDHGRTLGWLLVFWFAYLLDLGGDWGTIQRMCCTPTEQDAKKAALLATALSIPHAFLLLGPVFVARVMWAGELADPNVVSQAETIYGKVAVKLLPAGMIGVVAAAMFSATMSTLGVAWNVRSTSFVNDIYVRFLRPQASDREQILAGRLAVFGIGSIAIAVAVLVAVTSTGLFALAQDMIGVIVVPLVLPLLFGLLVRRTSNWAGLAGFAVSLVFISLNNWGYRLLGWQEPLVFEYAIPIAAVLSVAVMVATGYLPKSDEDVRRVSEFFARMKRPRPVAIHLHKVPPPLGIIGTFTLLIGGMMLLLCALPQRPLDRIITFGASVVLLLGGLAMKRRQKKLEQFVEEGKEELAVDAATDILT